MNLCGSTPGLLVRDAPGVAVVRRGGRQIADQIAAMDTQIGTYLELGPYNVVNIMLAPPSVGAEGGDAERVSLRLLVEGNGATFDDAALLRALSERLGMPSEDIAVRRTQHGSLWAEVELPRAAAAELLRAFAASNTTRQQTRAYLASLFAHLPKDLSQADHDLIERAYHVAAEAHASQSRRSGQPYIAHSVAVAEIVADMGLDVNTVAAALLHDTVEDTSLTLLDLDDLFGGEVAALVDGVTKLESIPRVKDGRLVDMTKRAPKRESEFLRKTILAMSQDVRVILIKLADRLDNMRSLEFLSPRRQRGIAEETMQIFAPLALRLGIWKMKCELEDLSFKYLQPERYREVRDALSAHEENAEAYLHRIARRIERQLAQMKIAAEVTLGQKHLYEIYRRMHEKNVPLERLHDLRPIRVIVDERLTCYTVLGLIHSLWRPVDGSFDDYIANPKDNFYKSLHTTIITKEKHTLTIQIRTPEMHEHAEYGVIAHWRYWKGIESDEAFERRIQYLRSLLEVGSDLEDADEFMDALRRDVFQDRVYVFTPHGDVVDLPVGATPIDFAYYIHTEIGHRCRGAKANGALVPLDYKLQTGDKIEIITATRGGPNLDWLNPTLGYVHTKRALTKIRQWFRHQGRAKTVAQGDETITRELRRLGAQMDKNELAALFSKSTDDFLAAVGSGDINGHQIAMRILEAERAHQNGAATASAASVLGAEGLALRRATCCNPVEGDPIVGYRSADGDEVVIHRADCPEVADLVQDDLLQLGWATAEAHRYPVTVVITAYDREGLMRDIGGVIAAERVNMTSVHITTDNNVATFQLVMEIANAAQLSRVLTKIEQLTNVIEVHRSTSTEPPAGGAQVQGDES